MKEIEDRLNLAKRFAYRLFCSDDKKGIGNSYWTEDTCDLYERTEKGLWEINWEPIVDEEWKQFEKKYFSSGSRTNWIVAIAATVLLLLGVAVWLFYTPKSSQPLSTILDKNTPTITLKNGNVYAVNSEGFKCFRQESRLVPALTDQGLNYENHGDSVVKSEWHTLQLPKQTEFILTLSDGTRIRLNAMSTLRYPVPFSSSKREVWIEGEAFFEVAKDTTKPFVVHAAGSRIEVLGTRFNVSCYKDQPCYTTLVNGSVYLNVRDKAFALMPGQEGIVSLDGEVVIRQADLDVALAWLDGRFYFKQQPLSKIMTNLSKWYGIEIQFFDHTLRDMLFSVETKRYEKIEQVLEIIENTKKVKFIQTERMIIVKKY